MIAETDQMDFSIAKPAFNIDETSQKLEHASLDEVLEWSLNEFGDNLGITTAFGYSGIFLIHKVLQHNPEINVFFIDTGFHFPETIAFANDLKEKWNLNLEIIRPAKSLYQLKTEIGDPPYQKNPDLCCQANKVEPLLSFVNKKQAWLSAIRRDQAVTRSNIEVLQYDSRGVLKIHPLYRWNSQQIWDYIKEHDLPYNRLHDENYMSIGCQPCTKPVSDPKNERSGRWPQINKIECGRHYYPGNL